MIVAIGLLVIVFLRLLRTRRRLLLENMALRQQLEVLKRRHPRPRMASLDKLFWILAQRFWSGWKRALILVSPESVARWNKSGFVLYWNAISQARWMVGRRRISKPRKMSAKLHYSARINSGRKTPFFGGFP